MFTNLKLIREQTHLQISNMPRSLSLSLSLTHRLSLRVLYLLLPLFPLLLHLFTVDLHVVGVMSFINNIYLINKLQCQCRIFSHSEFVCSFVSFRRHHIFSFSFLLLTSDDQGCDKGWSSRSEFTHNTHVLVPQ